MQTKLVFEAIGTKWQIDYALPDPSVQLADIEQDIMATIDNFDRSFSRFRPDSWVSMIREQPGTYTMPKDAYDLLHIYQKAYDATDGLVTPLVGRALEQAGYDAAYTLKSSPLDQVPNFDEVVTFDKQGITTRVPVLLDFGAAGKGYLIDRIGSELRRHGVGTFVVNAGGDILHSDSTDSVISVGLENPFDTNQALSTCDVSNESICASAGSRRAWVSFTHIINPRTRVSPSDVAGVWVKASSAADADIIATALFFVPPQQIRSSFDFAYAVLDTKMNMVSSKNFNLRSFNEVTI